MLGQYPILVIVPIVDHRPIGCSAAVLTKSRVWQAPWHYRSTVVPEYGRHPPDQSPYNRFCPEPPPPPCAVIKTGGRCCSPYPHYHPRGSFAYEASASFEKISSKEDWLISVVFSVINRHYVAVCHHRHYHHHHYHHHHHHHHHYHHHHNHPHHRHHYHPLHDHDLHYSWSQGALPHGIPDSPHFLISGPSQHRRY